MGVFQKLTPEYSGRTAAAFGVRAQSNRVIGTCVPSGMVIVALLSPANSMVTGPTFGFTSEFCCHVPVRVSPPAYCLHVPSNRVGDVTGPLATYQVALPAES